MISKVPSFEQAINASMLWCKAWDEGEISDEVLADRVAELLASRNGARGFFVVSLSSDSPLLDRLSDPLAIKLRAAGSSIIDLTVRNLAMSTAMALDHGRKANITQQIASERIKTRCLEILRLLDPAGVKNRLERLLEATKGTGEDLAFLNKWNYDSEQRNAIAKSVNAVAEFSKKKGS